MVPMVLAIPKKDRALARLTFAKDRDQPRCGNEHCPKGQVEPALKVYTITRSERAYSRAD